MTPPSTFSPDFRARRNIARMPCLLFTGKLLSRWKLSDAQPVESVGWSSIVNWLNGVPGAVHQRTLHVAAAGRGRGDVHAELERLRARGQNPRVRLELIDDQLCRQRHVRDLLRIARWAPVRCGLGRVVVVVVVVVAVGFRITAVGTRGSAPLPVSVDCRDAKRSVLPTSADVSVYLTLCAPLITAQSAVLITAKPGVVVVRRFVGPVAAISSEGLSLLRRPRRCAVDR